MLDPVLWDACVSSEGYTYDKARSLVRLPFVNGRPRFRLKDPRSVYTVSCRMDLSNSEYNEWQTFWKGAAGNGSRPFKMRLSLSDILVYDQLGEVYTVNAKEPWTAEYQHPNRWIVSLVVEAPWTFGFLATLCDIIYGGPVFELAEDDIYGGPIDNLATDIVAPCEGVLGV